MELIDQMLEILGYVMVICVVFFFLRIALLSVWKWITRPRQFDDDEKIYLKPTLSLFGERKAPSQETTERGIRYHFSYNGRIRRFYRKQILSGYQKSHHKMLPSSWASPRELELSSGLEDPELHRLYEKARYCREECTEDDWKSLRNVK
jgi:hypothetical protein